GWQPLQRTRSDGQAFKPTRGSLCYPELRLTAAAVTRFIRQRFTARVCLAFSCLAVVGRPALGDFRRRPFAGACRPFERYVLPFVDCAPFDSSCAIGQQDLRLRPCCRCAPRLGFRPCSPDCLDFRPYACFRLLRLVLLHRYLLPRPADYVHPYQCGCFQLCPLRLPHQYFLPYVAPCSPVRFRLSQLP